MTTSTKPETDEPPDSAGRASPNPSPANSWFRRLAYAFVFVAGAVAGLVYHEPLVTAVARFFRPAERAGEVLYWTSPMDPSVRSDRPGQDSMGMDLVPVYAEHEPPPKPVTIDPELRDRDYTTAVVDEGPLVRTIRTVSTVDYAEPLVGEVTLKVDAWLEKLSVDYEGQPVQQGDPLFDVYAPDLVAAQEEFLTSLAALDAAEKTRNQTVIQTDRENLESIRFKFRYWDVSEEQIERLQQDKQPHKTIRYFSPFTGIVVEKRAFEGRFMPAGELLYRIADLSRVWVYLYVYADQIHCVHEGQAATMRLPELPDQTFQGKVIYVYPYLEPKVRAVKVRLEFDNPDLLLKPDMFGRVALEPHEMGRGLRIPEAAVMKTGMRQLVYVTRPGNLFEAREVETGMELDGGMVEVLSGLRPGEQVVTPPDFLIDSESRLRLVNRKFAPAAMEHKSHAEHGSNGGHVGHSMNGMKEMKKEMEAERRSEAPTGRAAGKHNDH